MKLAVPYAAHVYSVLDLSPLSGCPIDDSRVRPLTNALLLPESVVSLKSITRRAT